MPHDSKPTKPAPRTPTAPHRSTGAPGRLILATLLAAALPACADRSPTSPDAPVRAEVAGSVRAATAAELALPLQDALTRLLPEADPATSALRNALSAVASSLEGDDPAARRRAVTAAEAELARFARTEAAAPADVEALWLAIGAASTRPRDVMTAPPRESTRLRSIDR